VAIDNVGAIGISKNPMEQGLVNKPGAAKLPNPTNLKRHWSFSLCVVLHCHAAI